MASNISASDTPPVTFELQIPEDVEMDPQKVFGLFEALQNDIESFDNMVIERVRNMETVEHVNEQIFNADHSDEQQTELQQEQQSVSLSVSDTSNTLPQKRFKQLNTEALLEIEHNQYSKSTKKKTKWGTRVFNGTYL
jgi:DNA-nicking Smr family endonuclease